VPRVIHTRKRAALLATLALALASCGGDDESTTTSGTEAAGSSSTGSVTTSSDGAEPTPSNEEQVTAAIETFFTGADSDVACDAVVTKKLIKTAYGSVAGCVDARNAGGVAKEVEISNLLVGDGRATATAVPTGGPNDGEKIKLVVVYSAGAWRLDELESNVPVGP
jgi:hypothetical protein